MPRPKKNLGYDQQKIMNDLLDTVLEEYQRSANAFERQGKIKSIAEELELAPHKVRKLLITAGVRDNTIYYSNPTCRRVLELHNKGQTVLEIMAITGLNRTSVCCYLPYSKGLYNASELSLTAEAVRRCRQRKARCEFFIEDIAGLSQEQTESYLWDTLQYIEGCIFERREEGSKKTKFKYTIEKVNIPAEWYRHSSTLGTGVPEMGYRDS